MVQTESAIDFYPAASSASFVGIQLLKSAARLGNPVSNLQKVVLESSVGTYMVYHMRERILCQLL